MKVKFMIGIMAGLLTSTVFANNDFVKREEGKFLLNNKEYKFVGTNNYYLHYKDNEMIEDIFKQAKDMGIKVIRMWGFGDGDSTKDNQFSIQPIIGQYFTREGDVDGFERIDYALSMAQKYDIKVVIALTNYWEAFGGMEEYTKWAGLKHKEEFYTDEKVKNEYKKFVNKLITSKNRYTGENYNSDPNIFAWELANEPRSEQDKSGKNLYSWVEEMSAYIKSLDSNHLVAIGDEGFFSGKEKGFKGDGSWAYDGFTGVDWEKLISIKDVDYGTIHLYPEHWGIKEENFMQWGEKYIVDHLKIANDIKKPVVLEEYGLTESTKYNRASVYETWNNVFFKNGGDGSMFWILTGIDKSDKTGYYPNYDGFRVVNDNTKVPNRLKEIAKRVETENYKVNSSVELVYPYNTQNVKGINRFEAKLSGEEKANEIVLKIGTQSFKMKLDTEKNVFFAEIDTKKFKDGSYQLKLEAKLENGKKLEDSSSINIKNSFKLESLMKIDLRDSKLQVNYEGSYQGEFKSVENHKLGKKINLDLSGKNGWEEVRVKLGVDEKILSETSKIKFSLLIPASFNSGIIKPYFALNPGFTKVGMDNNIFDLSKLKEEKIDNQSYFRLKGEVNFSQVKKINELIISFVGSNAKIENGYYIIESLELLTER